MDLEDNVFAIIASGGKQYRVEAGQTIKVSKLDQQPGDVIELNNILAIGDGDNVLVGQPNVSGAKVLATVVDQGREKKIIVFKFKAKKRYRRKQGHRQDFTRLSIEKILLPGAEQEKKSTVPKRKKAAKQVEGVEE